MDFTSVDINGKELNKIRFKSYIKWSQTLQNWIYIFSLEYCG